MERVLDRVSKAASDGYPPYNVERISGTGDKCEHMRIVIAVAGFNRNQLDVTIEENQLLIRGKQTEEKNREYLYQGIAARQFQRAFVLAEGIEVVGAELKDGLLSIDLARSEPEHVVKRINISTKDEKVE